MPALTLALSVLLCVGAMSDGASAAAVVQTLQRQAATAGERDSVATLISSLSEAARKLCQHHTGQAAAVMPTSNDPIAKDEPTAIRAYVPAGRSDTRGPILIHQMNLPPPVAVF